MDIKVSLTQLRYIIAVHQFGHFSKAAEFCRVAQPSMSLQIQRAEEIIGFLLFDRKRKPIGPTARGRRFIEQARIVLKEYDFLQQSVAAEADTLRGDFSMGVIPTVIPYLLPLFLKEFSNSYPEVNLYITELTTDAAILGLREGRIDVAIVATPLGEKGLRERVLYGEPFLCYASQGHSLLEQPEVAVDQLRSQDIWLLDDAHCMRNQVADICALKGSSSQHRNINFQGGSLEVLRQLIQNNDGYTLLPQTMVSTLSPEEIQQHIRPLSKPKPAREISLVHVRDHWKQDIIQSLHAVIVRCLPADLVGEKSRRSYDVKAIR